MDGSHTEGTEVTEEGWEGIGPGAGGVRRGAPSVWRIPRSLPSAVCVQGRWGRSVRMTGARRQLGVRADEAFRSL